MSTVFIEGFDKYGPPGQNVPSLASMLIQGEWNVIIPYGSDNPYVAPGLSESGYALAINGGSGGGGVLSKTLPASMSRIIGGFRFSTTLNNSGACQFLDSLTVQCAISINRTTGLLSIWSGAAAVLLQTSSQSISADTTHYLEYDVTFGVGGAGGWTVWLDGVIALTGSGTTQISGNASANVFQLCAALPVAGEAGVGLFIYDDLYIFSSGGSFNNSALLSNPRIQTQWPSADHQTQWTNNGNVVGQAASETTASATPGANTLFLRRWTPAANCTLNSVSCLPETTNAGANFKAVAYSDSSGSPNSLLSAGPQVTGSVSGSLLTGTLTTPQSLTAGTYYWLGFITDSAIALLQQDNVTTLGAQAANTYSSGAPGTAPSMTYNEPSWMIYGNATGASTNWESENLNPPIGDASSITSSTVNNEDLYTFPAIATDITAIYTVGVKANARIGTSGVRTLDLQTKSSSTDSGGSNTGQTLATSYEWYDSYFDADPATSVAWIAAGLNAAWHGPKLAS